MMKYLLSNPKAALLFVLGTLASVALLIGSEDQEGLLSQAVDDVAEQREGFARDIAELDRARGPRVRVEDPPEPQNWDEFNSDPIRAQPLGDESLIDQASGFDPSPLSPNPIDPNPGSDDEVNPETVKIDDLAEGEIVRILAQDRGMIIVED